MSGAGGVDVGLAGEREHVGEVGVAHRGVELEGLEVFGLPVAEPDGAGEVGLERAAGEDGVGGGGAVGGGVEVSGEAREGAVLDGEVGDLGVRGDAGRAQLAGDGGVDDGGAAIVQRDGKVVAERAEIVQVVGDELRAWICWPSEPERSTRVCGSWMNDWPSRTVSARPL